MRYVKHNTSEEPIARSLEFFLGSRVPYCSVIRFTFIVVAPEKPGHAPATTFPQTLRWVEILLFCCKTVRRFLQYERLFCGYANLYALANRHLVV